MSTKLSRRKQSHKLVAPLVAGFICMAMAGPVIAGKHYEEKNLKAGADGFRHLVGEDLTGLLVNRTLLLRHKRNKDIKIFMFHHQNGDQYIKVLGVNKFKGKIFKAPYQIRDGVRHATSISTGEAIRSRFYGNDDGLVWACGGTRGGCSYYSEESWDGDPQNLKN